MEGTLSKDSFTRPESVISQISIGEGAKVADFGTGHGYFSIPLAKLVGQGGMVYALDIQQSALEAVKSRAVMEGVTNLQTIWANLEIPGGTKLGNESVDLVLVKNVLFQTEKKEDILKEAYRVLAKKGYLVLIDWANGSQRDIGPQEGWFLSPEDAKTLVQSVGFSLDKPLFLDPYHFGFIFKK